MINVLLSLSSLRVEIGCGTIMNNMDHGREVSGSVHGRSGIVAIGGDGECSGVDGKSLRRTDIITAS